MNPALPAITTADHSALELAFRAIELVRPVGELEHPACLAPWLATIPPGPVPFAREADTKDLVRAMLRVGGFKPSGRSKPASEYLTGAAAEGRLAPINLVVDAANAASLHGGLPISVVDLDLAREPYSVAVRGPGERYVFNAAGQEIELAGLVCFGDASGPCASPVKDSHRTKTHALTRRALVVVWGVRAQSGLADAVADWAVELLRGAGAVRR